MPEVSRFYGIVIKIFYDDHNPPHFHAEYGEYEVLGQHQHARADRWQGAGTRAGNGDRMGLSASAGPPCSMGEGEAAPATRPDSTPAVNASASRITAQCSGPGARDARNPAADQGR